MNKIIIDKKAFSWFCISEKLKFPSNVPKDSHTFNLRYFAGGVFVCTKGFDSLTYRQS